jgi:hypothetical protein
MTTHTVIASFFTIATLAAIAFGLLRRAAASTTPKGR